MKMDKVIFRKFEDDQIIAIFPEIPGTMSFHTCQSYMHIGQHSACDDSLIDELERAKSSEYSDLFDELESIGYRLEVCDHLTYEMQENRKQQLLNGA